MNKINEQSPNAIGAEIGSEPTVHNKKFRFNFDSPYPILTLDLARQIGTFVHVDFDHIKVEDFFERMSNVADGMDKKPTTIGGWVRVAKLANQGLDRNALKEYKLRGIIREIIVELINEADKTK